MVVLVARTCACLQVSGGDAKMTQHTVRSLRVLGPAVCERDPRWQQRAGPRQVVRVLDLRGNLLLPALPTALLARMTAVPPAKAC